MPDPNESPVAVVIARTGTGDGRMDNTVATTEDHFPNVIIKVITPLMSIAIRSLRVYLQTLVGLLAAGGIGAASNTLPAHDFGALLMTCAGLSVASAAVCAIQNVIELLGNLDQKFPTLRG